MFFRKTIAVRACVYVFTVAEGVVVVRTCQVRPDVGSLEEAKTQVVSLSIHFPFRL